MPVIYSLPQARIVAAAGFSAALQYFFAEPKRTGSGQCHFRYREQRLLVEGLRDRSSICFELVQNFIPTSNQIILCDGARGRLGRSDHRRSDDYFSDQIVNNPTMPRDDDISECAAGIRHDRAVARR